MVKYFVTVRDDRRGGGVYAALLGPFEDAAAADGNVNRARKLAEKADPRTVFMGFGVTGIPAELNPVAAFNADGTYRGKGTTVVGP